MNVGTAIADVFAAIEEFCADGILLAVSWVRSADTFSGRGGSILRRRGGRREAWMTKRWLARWVLLAALLAPTVGGAGQIPAAGGGKITLAAATATALPMLGGTCAYDIFNGDAATIYVGTKSTIDNTTGYPVLTQTGYPMTITFVDAAHGTTIYLYSVAGTTTNAIVWISGC